MSSPSLPEGFTLHPYVIPDDIPASIDIGREAFKEDALELYLIPSHIPLSGRRAWKIQRTEKRLTDPADAARQRYIKVVKDAGTEEEEIVAYAGWWAPRIGKEGARTPEEKKKERDEALRTFPEGANMDELNKIVDGLEMMKTVKLGEDWEQHYWYLSALATHPNYGRRGFGSALVQWGVQQAEAQLKENPEGPVKGLYIEATPTGLPVYLRNGFREVASFTHELAEGKEYKHVCLLRKLKR